MGAAGAGSLAQVVNTAIAGKARFDEMKAFFDGVGTGDASGVWQGELRKAPGIAKARTTLLDTRAKGSAAC